MESYLPKFLRHFYHNITNYEKEIADPVQRIKVEMHVKTLFGVFLTLSVAGFIEVLCLNANTTTSSSYILLISSQVYCATSLMRLYYKKPQNLGMILSVFLMVVLYLGTNFDESLTFCGLVFSITMPNFVLFLTQSNRMAFFGLVYSIVLNVITGPKFYSLIVRESGSQYLANLLDAGRATFNVYAIYDFAFSALGDSRSNKILSTLSETLRAEQQIKQEKELLHSKSMFFSCFSHEMRNPLNCILGSMDYAIKYATDDVICDILSTGKACGCLLVNLINNILDMGKLDSNNIALNEDMRDSKQFITNIWRVTQELFKKKKQHGEIFVDRDFPVMVMVDETRLTQVLVNLISNACKFTGEGKMIKVVFSFDLPDFAPDRPSPSEFDFPNLKYRTQTPEKHRPEITAIQNKQSEQIQKLDFWKPRNETQEDHIDQANLEKLIDIRSRKTLFHVRKNSEMASPRPILNRYILLFSTEGSLKELTDWNPLANSNISMRRQKGTIKIEVIDSGCGMTSEEVGKLFKPFIQANKTITGTYGGTGLGLYITQSLTKLMKGTVTVKSERNVGSTFTVTIPNDPIASLETCSNNKHLKSLSAFSRFQIIVCSNMSDSKGHWHNKSHQLSDFVEKMRNLYYHVEQIDHFVQPSSLITSKTTFLKTYFIYDASCLTAQNIDALKSMDIHSAENMVFVLTSNAMDLHPKLASTVLSHIIWISEADLLSKEIHTHTKELLTTIKSKHSILIVDDDDFNRRIFSVFLAREGYNIYTAQNGQEGYEVFCEHANDIHMVIVDYEMPICDGPTCAEKILKFITDQNMDAVPIHALTGNVSQESIARIAQAGIRKAWNKPAKLEEIMDEIFHLVVK